MATLLSSMSTLSPFRFAQLGDGVLMSNGHNPNQWLDLRTHSSKVLGLAAPGAAPTKADAAGVLTGAYIWRVRWWDQSTQTISLPSAELSDTMAAETPTLTVPGSAPSRCTHWIIERTTAGGRVFYPVNQSSAAPDGTAIGTTTYADSVTDATIRNRQAYPSNQGQPTEHAFCFANGAVLFMGGGRLYSGTCSCTSGAAAVSAGTGFVAAMVGDDLVWDEDSDGIQYRISAFGSASTLTLATNLSGSTKSAKAFVSSSIRDWIAWCEPGQGEYWGSALLGGGLSNTLRIGDDGQPLTSGVGLGQAGALFAKESKLYRLAYQLNPQLTGVGNGDGRLIPLQSRRGAFGFRSMRRIENYVYGVDHAGVWRAEAGGEPVEIGGAIIGDWGDLYMYRRSRFHIGWDPTEKMLYVFVCTGTDAYPKVAYLWDLVDEKWVGTKTWPYGIPDTFEASDLTGQMRMCFSSAPKTGSVYNRFWMNGIGYTLGVNTGESLRGTCSASSGAAAVGGGPWGTAGTEGTVANAVTVTKASTGTIETQIVISQTALVLTTTSFTSITPASGDTYVVGLLNASMKSGRIVIDPTRKKYFKRAYVRMMYDTGAIKVNVRVYYDGSTTAFSDRVVALTADGVTAAATTAAMQLDPTSQEHRYYIPLGNQWADDIQLEFYSHQVGNQTTATTVGNPWQIVDVAIEYDLDDNDDPAKK